MRRRWAMTVDAPLAKSTVPCVLPVEPWRWYGAQEWPTFRAGTLNCCMLPEVVSRINHLGPPQRRATQLGRRIVQSQRHSDGSGPAKVRTGLTVTSLTPSPAYIPGPSSLTVWGLLLLKRFVLCPHRGSCPSAKNSSDWMSCACRRCLMWGPLRISRRSWCRNSRTWCTVRGQRGGPSTTLESTVGC